MLALDVVLSLVVMLFGALLGLLGREFLLALRSLREP